MANMGNSPLLIHKHIEPVLNKVFGNHHARGDDAMLLGEILLVEVLCVWPYVKSVILCSTSQE